MGADTTAINVRQTTQSHKTAAGKLRLGFLINPIAGMGGRVGLKGTDNVVEEAISRGASPTSNLRALECLNALAGLMAKETQPPSFHWLSCAGQMGADALAEAGFQAPEIVHDPGMEPTAKDTERAVKALVAGGVDLIVFCGGDGTARDISSITSDQTPIVGIPAGVKMYSGVFGTSPARTAEIIFAFLKGGLSQATVDVLDLDEQKYRRGTWAVQLYTKAATPYEPNYTQAAKVLIAASSDAETKQDIADYLREEIVERTGTLVLLGPGSTVQSVAETLGTTKTLLGIDAVFNQQLVAADLDEHKLLGLLNHHTDCILVLSPIGAQGFILGRGNLQLSPDVIRRIGTQNIIVVATPAKLARTPVLHVDTSDAALDRQLVGAGYISVVVGYRRRRMVKIEA